jgi:hypothetical protein
VSLVSPKPVLLRAVSNALMSPRNDWTRASCDCSEHEVDTVIHFYVVTPTALQVSDVITGKFRRTTVRNHKRLAL